MLSPIASPTLALNESELVDWLELTALFNQYGVARIDSLLGALLEQEESAEDNIAERDRHKEQLIEKIENEITLRQKLLKGSYPFELSGAADELTVAHEWRELPYNFYVVCLFTSHVTGSVVFIKPPSEDLVQQLRNDIFQIIATLGLAGEARGPAFSVGWPRRSGETIVELLTRAAALGGGFGVRIPPGIYTPPKEKDGGVDVIAWSESGLPPPTKFFWGQTASGKNWQGKPVTDHANLFQKNYMQDHMTGNHNYITMIPFRILDRKLFNRETAIHKGILDRMHLPLKASEGFDLASSGITVDVWDRIPEIKRWIEDYTAYAMSE